VLICLQDSAKVANITSRIVQADPCSQSCALLEQWTT